MSRYRKVLVRMWDDEKFRARTEDGRSLFQYHLTSPRSTPFLLYVEGPGAIADGLQWGIERVRNAMGDLAAADMARYASDASNLVFLPNALTIPENAPQGPNEVKTWLALFRDLPKSPFRDKALEHWRTLGLGIGHGFSRQFVEACEMARPIQEQEQEQDTGAGRTVSAAPPALAAPEPPLRGDTDATKLVNEYARQFFARFGVAAHVSPGKDGAIAKRLLKNHTLGRLERCLPAFFELQDKLISENGYTFSMFEQRIAKLIVDVHSANGAARRRSNPQEVAEAIRREHSA